MRSESKGLRLLKLVDVSAIREFRGTWDDGPNYATKNLDRMRAFFKFGLEEVGDGLWDVYFGPVTLGRMDERTSRITDHKGRTVRRASPTEITCASTSRLE